MSYTNKKALARLVAFCLGTSALTAAVPAGAAVIDYPNGSNNSSTIVLTDNSTQLQVLTGSATQSGVVSESGGSFGLEKIGAGTLIYSGANTYTGITTISAGALQIGDGTIGHDGRPSNTIIDNGALIFDFSNGGFVQYGGSISGTGSLTQSGFTLTLTGANTYSGGTTIASGTTLQIGTGGSSGSIVGNVVDNGTLALARSDSIIFAGDISGSGQVTVPNQGTVILTGNNSYTGGTTLSSQAVLRIGNGGTTGSLTGNINTGGQGALVIFNRSDSTGFNGVISGPGQVLIGNGTVTLNGANTYTGGTQLTGGTLVVTSDGNLGASSGSLLLSGTGNAIEVGTLRLGASFDIANTRAVGLGQAVATIDTNGFNTSIFQGIKNGTGGLVKMGTGTLALGGQSTYAGGTTINGGVLQIALGASLANGPLTINSGALAEFDGSFTNTNATITVNNGGTLLLKTAGTTPLAGSKVVMAGGLLDTDTTGADIRLGSVEGSGTLTLRNNTLSVGGLNTDITLAATVTGAQLNKIGTGTLTLTGSNTYNHGGVSVNAGTVVLGAGGSLSTDSLNIRTGGSFVAGTSTTISALSMDSGSLAATPGTTLNFTNNVTFAGNGPLVFGSSILTGTITLAGIGCCTPFNSTIEVAGGTVRDLTSPPLLADRFGSLSFAAYMAPLFTVDTGATVDFNDHSVRNSAQPSKGLNLRGAGQVLLGSTATTEMQIRSTNFSGIISGAGTVTFLSNTAAHILSGANTYTGGTTINSGATLQLGTGGTSGSITGNVANNGALIFNRSDAVTLSSAISGTGTVAQSGSGTLTLSGTSSYTGATAVNAGTLNVMGKIASSAVSVANGATLTGTGTVGAITVASGGTLTPGGTGAPGTLTVSGNLSLAAGANFVDFITPSSAGLVTASGTASINGNAVANLASGSYAIGQRFTLITAAGGLSGTFASLNTLGLPTSLRGRLSYDANNAYLNLDPNALAPLLSNATGNQNNVAKGIDKAVQGGAALPASFQALFNLSGPALNSALDQLAGPIGPNVVNSAGQTFQAFLSLMGQGGDGGGFAPGGSYGNAGAPHRAQLGAGQMRVWGSAYGGHIGLSADPVSGAASLSASNVGMVGGVDMRLRDGLLLGATLGWGGQHFRSDNGTGTSDDVAIGIYGRHEDGALYVSAALGYGWHHIKTLRTLTVSGTDVLQGVQDATDFGGRLETGWHFALDEISAITPYAAFVGDSVESPHYAETAVSGTSTFALSVAPHTDALGRMEAGARLSRDYTLEDGTLTGGLQAAWAHQINDVPLTQASFLGLSGANFLVTGVRPARDAALLGAALEMRQRSGFFFGVRGESLLGSGTTTVEGMGELGWHW